MFKIIEWIHVYGGRDLTYLYFFQFHILLISFFYFATLFYFSFFLSFFFFVSLISFSNFSESFFFLSLSFISFHFVFWKKPNKNQMKFYFLFFFSYFCIIFLHFYFVHFVFVFVLFRSCSFSFLNFSYSIFSHLFFFHFISFFEMEPNETTSPRTDITHKINHYGRGLTYACAAAVCKIKQCKKIT